MGPDGAGGSWDADVHSTVSLQVLLALIELLYDTDDEVRDAARCAVDDAIAVSSLATPPGGRSGKYYVGTTR